MGASTVTARSTPTALRITCLRVWLSSGTRITKSPVTWQAQLRRASGAKLNFWAYVCSRSPAGVNAWAEERTPNLAKSPFSTSTLHLPQVWRPPQIDSISTPKRRAASNSVVPAGISPCACAARRQAAVRACQSSKTAPSCARKDSGNAPISWPRLPIRQPRR